jgi:hypothetical protein
MPDWLWRRIARPAQAEPKVAEADLSEPQFVTDEWDDEGLESFDLSEPTLKEPGAPAAAPEMPDEGVD